MIALQPGQACVLHRIVETGDAEHLTLRVFPILFPSVGEMVRLAVGGPDPVRVIDVRVPLLASDALDVILSIDDLSKYPPEAQTALRAEYFNQGWAIAESPDMGDEDENFYSEIHFLGRLKSPPLVTRVSCTVFLDAAQHLGRVTATKQIAYTRSPSIGEDIVLSIGGATHVATVVNVTHFPTEAPDGPNIVVQSPTLHDVENLYDLLCEDGWQAIAWMRDADRERLKKRVPE